MRKIKKALVILGCSAALSLTITLSNSTTNKNAFGPDKIGASTSKNRTNLANRARDVSKTGSPTACKDRGETVNSLPMKEGEIQGTVTDVNGNSLSLEGVYTFPDSNVKIKENVFWISGLKIGKKYDIVIAPKGWWHKEISVLLDLPHKKIDVIFGKKKRVLEGFVRDSVGRVLAGVRMWIKDDYPFLERCIATTDETGRFSVNSDGTDFFGFRWEFEKEGYPYAWILNALRRKEDEPLEIIMSRTTATIKGKLMVGDKPYNGMLFLNGDGIAPLQGTDRAKLGLLFTGIRYVWVRNGDFSVDGLPPARVSIYFFVKKYVGKTITVDLTDGEAEASLSFDDKGSAIEGYVFDKEGRIAASKTVFCRPVNPLMPYMFVPSVDTDEEGKFRIEGLAAGEYIIFSRNPITRSVRVYIDENQTIKNILLFAE